MNKADLLVVEDDPELSRLIGYNLEKQGYTVRVVGDGEAALEEVRQKRPDLLLLDWMLPGISGLEVCRQLRGQPKTATLPIVMLSARGEETDTIRGLDTGADDYLVKPFSMDALFARVKAMLRRLPPADKTLRFDTLVMDRVSHKVERSGRLLTLGPTEYRLLEFFMLNPGKVFSREELLKHAWERSSFVELRTVDVHIRRLRQTLNEGDEQDLIRTVRARGYALDLPQG
ncbi:phosphate regulon transcriptional regulatory protein PhoB [Acetobacter pomorum]|uniref:Phosphate regulon transcriptional regulatory protein PhoB n=1 Tax=Acetobacter pomorum TaxID=65959 RepID=A0A2G4RFX5_9PROT|nr:phosphate regulon transcriptional regulator PhoB [Acetobacter pomorum]PHY95491.1 phosphate regulon transcriptional regulatory protein PhoB [Acetobacter pomorum]GBR47889.1 phosphate regulon response regulator PhoB [Acetobacter pomorum DSM 11825]